MARYMRGNRSTACPQWHVAVSVGTKEIQDRQRPDVSHQVLDWWSARFWRVQKGNIQEYRPACGKGCDEWWYWIGTLPRSASPLWIWTHDAGRTATHLNLWCMVDSGAITYRRGILEDSPFLCWISSGSRRMLILDIANWWRCPMPELYQEMSGEVYPELDPDDMKGSRRRRADEVAQVIQSAVTVATGWVRDHDMGQFRPTVAQQAWHSWRHQYQGRRLVYHDDPEISTHERRGYFGGRVECYFQGAIRDVPPSVQAYQGEDEPRLPTLWDERIHVLDVASMYPSVMRGRQYPIAVADVRNGMYPGELESVCQHYDVMAAVRIHTDTPCVPYRDNGVSSFPIGTWWGVYPTPEIQWLLRRGLIRQVGKVVCYERADIFTDWIDRMFCERRRLESEGRQAQAAAVKILTNSLAGKFGQRSGGWIDKPSHRAKRQWGEWMEMSPDLSRYNVYRGIAGNTQQRVERGESPLAMVSIAAHITSHARIRLLEILDVLPAHTCVYCHTDSVHVTDAGLAVLRHRGLIGSGEIGDLRLIGTCEDAEYLGVNCYRHGSRYVVGGVPRQTVRTGPWLWSCAYAQGVQELLRDGTGHTVQVRHRDVELVMQRMGGRVTATGWIRPNVVEDIRTTAKRDELLSDAE